MKAPICQRIAQGTLPAATVAAPPSERLVRLLRPLLPVGSELVLDHAEVSRHTTVKVRLGDRTLAAVRVADADLAAGGSPFGGTMNDRDTVALMAAILWTGRLRLTALDSVETYQDRPPDPRRQARMKSCVAEAGQLYDLVRADYMVPSP